MRGYFQKFQDRNQIQTKGEKGFRKTFKDTNSKSGTRVGQET